MKYNLELLPPFPLQGIGDDLASDRLTCVTLKEQDKRWIGQQIQSQLKPLIDSLEALRLAKTAQSKGWKTALVFMREWGLMTVPLGMLAIILTLIVAVVANYRSTEHRLTLIEAKLNTATAMQAPKQTLKALSSLDPKKLALNLQALRLVSQQPTAKVEPSSEELKTVAYNLSRVNQNTEDYWPTVIQFLEFASAHYATNAPPPGSPITYSLAHSQINFVSKFPPGSVVEMEAVNLDDVTFVDSRIIFKNTLGSMKNVRFINCAFEFRTTEKASPYLEAVGRQLLDSGIQSATINGL